MTTLPKFMMLDVVEYISRRRSCSTIVSQIFSACVMLEIVCLASPFSVTSVLGTGADVCTIRYKQVAMAVMLNLAFPWHDFIMERQDKPVFENVREMLSVRCGI